MRPGKRPNFYRPVFLLWPWFVRQILPHRCPCCGGWVYLGKDLVDFSIQFGKDHPYFCLGTSLSMLAYWWVVGPLLEEIIARGTPLAWQEIVREHEAFWAEWSGYLKAPLGLFGPPPPPAPWVPEFLLNNSLGVEILLRFPQVARLFNPDFPSQFVAWVGPDLLFGLTFLLVPVLLLFLTYRFLARLFWRLLVYLGFEIVNDGGRNSDEKFGKRRLLTSRYTNHRFHGFHF